MRGATLFLTLVILSGSASAIVFTDVFTREPNITIEYMKTPKIYQGTTPKFSKPSPYLYDTVLGQVGQTRIDPRTCPGELAICYQLREHVQEADFTYGRNYTSTSTYSLPRKRLKFRYCIGDDLACVRESVGCFCPQETVPEPPVFLGRGGKCSDTKHLCRDTYGSFILCEGNLSDCREQYLECGCGKAAACLANKAQTCVNNRKELISCQNTLPVCINQYTKCYCGLNMMRFQKPCKERTQTCYRDGVTVQCIGSFEDCALKYDRCACGAEP